MEREIVRHLPQILLGMFIVGVLLFLLSLQQLRRRRTGAYWRLRRRAAERGGKLFLVSVGLISLSVVLGIVTAIGTLVYRSNNPYLNRGADDLYGIVLSPEAILTATSEAIVQLATATPTPTDTPIPPTPEPPTPVISTFTPTLPLPSATFTASSTFTPTTNFAAVLKLTPIFNTTPRPASPGFRLSVDSATDGVDSEGQAGHQFKAGIKRIYLFITFGNMENGVAWSRVLYRDGVAIQGSTLLWSLGTSGSSYFFFGDETGYSAGDYEVRLYVGDQEVSRYPFDVTA